jgi:hypothetical protein
MQRYIKQNTSHSRSVQRVTISTLVEQYIEMHNNRYPEKKSASSQPPASRSEELRQA